jgi:hypothetical protein
MIECARIGSKHQRPYSQATGNVGWDIIFAKHSTKTREPDSSELNTYYHYNETEVRNLTKGRTKEHKLPGSDGGALSLKHITTSIAQDIGVCLFRPHLRLLPALPLLFLQKCCSIDRGCLRMRLSFIFSGDSSSDSFCFIPFCGSVKICLVL